MRKVTFLLACVTVLVLGATGCSGPEQKLGRGMNNLTEFARMGEIRRSVEQTALWDGPDTGYTTGFIQGFDRSVARTLVGAYEVVTFPIPSYKPLFTNYLSPTPVYPDSYKPTLLADPIFGNDANLGYAGGDVVPFVPGSRFRVFDY
jgi:putative exosortase-associated protein (TIGR04073 family)